MSSCICRSLTSGLLLSTALGVAAPVPAQDASGQSASQTAPEDRQAFFGEQHIHTSWSVDAWLFGNHLTGPDAAFKYAQGETIKHPLGYDITLEQPLD